MGIVYSMCTTGASRDATSGAPRPRRAGTMPLSVTRPMVARRSRRLRGRGRSRRVQGSTRRPGAFVGAAHGRAELLLCWILSVSTLSALRRRGTREKCKKDTVCLQIVALISRYTLVARAHFPMFSCRWSICGEICARRAFQNSHDPKSNTKGQHAGDPAVGPPCRKRGRARPENQITTPPPRSTRTRSPRCAPRRPARRTPSPAATRRTRRAAPRGGGRGAATRPFLLPKPRGGARARSPRPGPRGAAILETAASFGRTRTGATGPTGGTAAAAAASLRALLAAVGAALPGAARRRRARGPAPRRRRPRGQTKAAALEALDRRGRRPAAAAPSVV